MRRVHGFTCVVSWETTFENDGNYCRGGGQNSGKDYVAKMKDSGRYIQELWS